MTRCRRHCSSIDRISVLSISVVTPTCSTHSTIPIILWRKKNQRLTLVTPGLLAWCVIIAFIFCIFTWTSQNSNRSDRQLVLSYILSRGLRVLWSQVFFFWRLTGKHSYRRRRQITAAYMKENNSKQWITRYLADCVRILNFLWRCMHTAVRYIRRSHANAVSRL